ncbi:hypothetical protein BOTBODRAFT_526222, partial [Botryobasidium botryosum FD-172 SS1]
MDEDIEGRDSDDRTRLHSAIQAKDFQLAKQLVEQGADVRARDTAGWGPFHVLAQLETDYLDILSPSPFAEMIQVLLNAGADLSAQSVRSQSPLHIAYIRDSSLIFRLLVDAGADMSPLDWYTGADMRRFLVRVLHPPDDTADLDYLPVGVDVNATDSQGYIYLDRAVWLGSPSVVKALLRCGADPNRSVNWRHTTLHYAFNLMQHPDGAGAIQALLDAGADVNARADGYTPLDRAASHACPPAFRMILARGRVFKQKIHFSDRFLLAPEGTDAVTDVIEAEERFA